MAYYFAKKTALDYDEATARIKELLQEEGFGVITEIDVKETFKKKLDLEFRPYVILGACNPTLAHQALSSDDKIGSLLPCNVVVQQAGEGSEVFAMDPGEIMTRLVGEELREIGTQVAERLRHALNKL